MARNRLIDLRRRLVALRDQVIAVAVVIVLVDVLWVFALVAWIHHRSGRTALACASLVAALACAAALAHHLVHRQRAVLAAIDHLLRRDLPSVDR